MDIKGTYNTARVFTDNLENEAREQVKELLEQPFTKGLKIRIMPDAHAGKGCVIGTTMTIADKVVPNLVGLDIGCGMLVTRILTEHRLENSDLQRLDDVIRKHIPSGFSIRTKPHHLLSKTSLTELRCRDHVDLDRARMSLGTLGGGNHFIELNEDEEKNLYLVIHSGSRNIGKQVAEYYQNLAIRSLSGSVLPPLVKKKKKGKEKVHIPERGKPEESPSGPPIPKGLAYLEGQHLEDYLHDIGIIQNYADISRQAMAHDIIREMDWKTGEQFTTIHNYIDLRNRILRKGSVSAEEGEKLIIPINMRDGSLICVGKGNSDWNQSAPHGAGRLMSRTKAREVLSLEDFRRTMKDVWTTSVTNATIDEAPFAYKPMEEIIANIGDTVDILKRIKPIYNFKAP
jgi:RNA-splicing ligase RtcB